jgi:hypothetical protein
MWLVAQKAAGGLGGIVSANLSGPSSAQKPPHRPSHVLRCARCRCTGYWRYFGLLSTEAVDDGDRRTAGRVVGGECHQIRIASPALGL